MQIILTLIVITTIVNNVCESLPQYCKCIQSEGNPFSAFAEYFSSRGKKTELWLYQNKQRCRMIAKQTEIVIHTSGQIESTNEVYHQWFGFYFKDNVYECRTYQKSQSNYVMECRKGIKNWISMREWKSDENFKTMIALIEGTDGSTGKRLKIGLLYQKYSDNKWNRSERSISFDIDVPNWALDMIGIRWKLVFNKDSTNSQTLRDLMNGIISDIYINAVINAYDEMYGKKGFFIFVTHEGIHKYCYKSFPKEQTDRCKIENMKTFMPECSPKVMTTNATEDNTKSNTENKKESNTETTTETVGQISIVWIFIALIVIAIVFSIPFFICLILIGMKTEKSNSQRTGDKNNANNVSQKMGKQSIVYPKYKREIQVSNDSKISSNIVSKESDTTLPFSVHSKKDLQKSSADSIERPVDLFIRKKK